MKSEHISMTATQPVAHLRGRIFTFLIRKAVQRDTSTYEEIALRFGLPSSGSQLAVTLSPILGDLFKWCERSGQPKITSLVVRKSGAEEGLPGRGFWTLLDLELLDTSAKRVVLKTLQNEVYTFYSALQ
jgi:hypothetical protein